MRPECGRPVGSNRSARIAAPPPTPSIGARMRFAVRALFALAALSALAAHAQAPVDATTARVSLTGYAQFNTTLDAGGRFNWAGGLASASVRRQATPQL